MYSPMRHVPRSQGDRPGYQCLSDTVSGGAWDRDGKEDTEEVDKRVLPNSGVVVKLEVRVGVGTGQLLVR